jgi:hypothetical protein
MNKNRVFGPIILALLLLILCACSGKKSPPVAKPPAGPMFPYGVYISQTGDYILEINVDGSFSRTAPAATGFLPSTGTFSVQGKELTWTKDSYCDKPGLGNATYTWSYENETLMFQTKGTEPCDMRMQELNYIRYTIKK